MADPAAPSYDLHYGGKALSCALIRSPRRRKSYGLRLNRDDPDKVELLIPARLSQRSAEAFLQQNAAWVFTHFVKLRATQPQDGPRLYQEGSFVRYRGFPCRVQLIEDPANPLTCTLKPHRLLIRLASIPTDPEELHEAIKSTLTLWLRKRARLLLQKRLAYWSARTGLAYRRFFMAQARQRWGSCTADQDIRLHWHLILAPPFVLDYVVIHELCHVRHKNHGPAFWALVGHHSPSYQKAERALREEGRLYRL